MRENGIQEMKATILVVDDEPVILALLHRALGDSGFVVIKAEDIPRARQQIKNRRPDILVLDWMLPTGEGLELLQQLRESEGSRTLPVIMLSAKGEEQAIVQALEAGADDFVCKPFSTRELVARIKAVLRRTQDTDATEERELRRGDLTIDLVARRVWLNHQEIRLRLSEFDLLTFLARNEEQAFSRGALMEQIWKTKRDRLDRTVDIHVSRLRKALAAQQAEGLIQTVHRTGYRFSLRR